MSKRLALLSVAAATLFAGAAFAKDNPMVGGAAMFDNKTMSKTP